MVKLLSKFQPRYIIAITLFVAILMFGSAIIELRQSREELFHVLQEHSHSLAETIANSSSNIVLSTDQIEQQLSERLLNNANFIARLDSAGLLSDRDLRSIAAENNIFRINIFNRRGVRIQTNHSPEAHKEILQEKYSPQEILKPILSGKTKQLIIGLKEARFESGQRYAVAVRRTHRNGGAIVLNLDAAQIVEFRKSIGIGKLLKDLGNNSGIEYVVLQDRDGILAATHDVREMSNVQHDATLAAVLERDTTITRETVFHGQAVYEVIKRLSIEGNTIGVLRIGLSMDEIRTTDQRMQRRLLVMTAVLAMLAVLIVLFFVASRNFKVVSRKYEIIQTLTGNILENMNDAVVTVNSDGRISIFNRQAEELFGISIGEAVDKRIDELSVMTRKCLSSIFSNTEKQFEQTMICGDEKEHIVSVSISDARKPDNSNESRTAVIKDLTKARRLEKEIQRKEKLTAMGELASGVAHEIRNPLNAISMIAQRYEKEFTPGADVEEYQSLTQVLKREITRVNGIIQQFLRFARPPAVRLARVSASDFIAHISALFHGQAEEKNVVFSAESGYDGAIQIDAEQMTQALLNLLQNALAATQPRGEIRLRLNIDGAGVVFEVADTGSGIAQDILENIYDLYFTTKSTGTGIGLSITQQIVMQHNGSIDVQSEVTKGTIFRIVLPNS